MTQARSRYIASPAYDVALFIATPLLCLVLGYAASTIAPEDNTVFFLDQQGTLTSIVLRTVIHSHLVIVFFRSHANLAVFRRHPWRFTLVPIVLMAASMLSLPFLAAIIIIAAYWDAYHSSMQTFGIGRIYDMRAGADVNQQTSRQLDIWLNHYIYLGPFIAGPIWIVTAQLMDVSKSLAGIDLEPLKRVIVGAQTYAFWIIVVSAPLFLIVYVAHAVRRHRAGEPVSWQKYALLASTGVTSVWAWGFNPFGQALLIVNAFHSIQYFAIVYWFERDNLGKVMGTSSLPGARILTAVALVVAGCAYGFWFNGVGDFWINDGWTKRAVLTLTNVVAILHFWYDGFIWSVRKKDV